MTSSYYAARQRDLWLTRFYYFFYLGGMGFIFPFLNIFYVRLGLSGAQIGWIAAVGACVSLIIAPIWTNRNDQWHNPRAMLQLALFLTALSFLWLSWQQLFIGVIIVTFFRVLVGAGISPLSDALALSVTSAVRKGFGTVRVWASIGWVLWVLLSGWLIEQTTIKTGLFGVSITLTISAMLLFWIGAQNFRSPVAANPEQPSLRGAIYTMLHNRSMVSVGIMILVIGTSNSGVAQFETVYLDALGAEESLIGIAGMLGAVVEIPFMLWSDRLVSRQGAYRLLLLSMVMTAALRAMVLVFPTVGSIMVERAGGGIAFSFYVISLTRFVGEQAAPHQLRTVMALYTVTLTNLIGIIAPPLAGVAFDLFGARWLYAVAAGGYLLGWLVLRLGRQPPISGDSGSRRSAL